MLTSLPDMVKSSPRGVSCVTDAVIVFNRKAREAEPGATGKLAGILKSSVLVEVGGT